MITIYGIKNCDTMSKTFKWFDNKKIPYQFHNYKTEGLSKTKFNNWLQLADLNVLINTKGTTFRSLSDSDKLSILKKVTSFEIVSNNTSVLKRPIIEINDQLIIGFKPEVWEKF